MKFFLPFKLVFLGFVLCIVGCATPQSIAPVKISALNVDPSTGAVVVSVYSNMTPLWLVDGFLTIKSSDDGKEYVLSDKSEGGATYGVFFEQLPPGRYELKSLHRYPFSTQLKSPIGVFSVRAGEILDLGGLLFDFASYDGMGGGEYQLYHVSPGPAHQRLVGMTQKDVVVKSVSDGNLPDIAGIGSRNSVEVSQSRITHGSNSVLFGKSFGFIDVWRGVEFEGSLQLGYPYKVRAVSFTEDGRILAGLEEGLLLLSDKSFRNWRPLAIPSERGTVRLIESTKSAGYVLVIEEEGSFRVFLTRSLEDPKWESIGEGRIAGGVARTQLNPQLIDDLLVIPTSTAGFWKVEASIHHVDLVTKKWEVNDVELYSAVAYAYKVLPDLSVATIAGPNMNSSFMRSTDFGKNWSEYESPSWLQGVLVKDGAIYSPRLEDLGFSAAGQVITLWKSADNGKTWREVGEMPKLMLSINSLASPGAFLFVDWFGQRYQTVDDGATWRLLSVN